MLPPRKSVFIGGAIVAAAVGGSAMLAGGLTIRAQAGAPEEGTPAQAVDVAPAVVATIVDSQEYSGKIEAVDDVDVRPLVSGTIVAVHFKDTAIVRKGAPLFTIDPRPFKAAYDVALAQVVAARSRAAYTATEAARSERLLSDNATAKRDYDAAQNASREAQANLQAALATLETARVNLGYTQISAPVAGRASRAELTVGNIVAAGAAAPILTKIVSVSPIYAAFDVDEQTYLASLSRSGAKAVPVLVGLADEAGFSRKGIVDSVDNRLNDGSGTIRVRARLDNTDGRLVPGLYARVRIAGGQPYQAVMASDVAIGTDQDKKFLWVVNGAGKVERRDVTLGGLHEGLRVIRTGIKAGERVIVDGVQRVAAGDRVAPHSVTMPRSWQRAGLTAN